MKESQIDEVYISERMDDDYFPEPLPPVRKVSIACVETSTETQCSTCQVKRGMLTCPLCQAVGYCGASCQLEQWEEHQVLCGQISRQIWQTRASAEPLQTYRLPDSSIVNLFQDNLGILECSGGDGTMSAYYSARRILVDLLKKCGDLNNSRIAYDLAAENLLDLMAQYQGC